MRLCVYVCVRGAGWGSKPAEHILHINPVIRKQPIKMSPGFLVVILQARCLLFTVAFRNILAWLNYNICRLFISCAATS